MAMTRGIASPRAWGQAMTRTVTTRSTAKAGSSGRNASHATSVTAAVPNATRVNTNAARSARACARDRDDCACATSRMIPASAVRSPAPVTSTRNEPDPFTVPAMTLSRSLFSTGRDSPVIIDSFTELVPCRTIPSAGIRAPGLTSTRSPLFTSLIGTSCVSSPTIRAAVSGSSFASSFSAPCA